jgi:light-regulated signal transduction histidine kinase (bacteriophytochrome)
LLEDYGEQLDEEGKDYLFRLRAASLRMGNLIDGLLQLSRLTRGKLHREELNLSKMVSEITAELQGGQPNRQVEFIIQPNLQINGDIRLLRVALQNMLNNAWKFTQKKAHPEIEFGQQEIDGQRTFFVRDNGAGFDMAYVDKLFSAFQRLHTVLEFDGTGIGLATVQRIIQRHGGTVWGQGKPDHGATFFFTLPPEGTPDGVVDTQEEE